ncbi:class I SAM-dependent methyltransferase [Polynucleobacter sp. IMCC 29146]|uniref:class I SAM-dependent methyltransferase n=1 Tax=Polynucleobacter sp. IMCC 29146 TaxID=2780953 RepID=UPI001F25FC55|nr:class I SAM-dependent methyltransferase [Polynucleobacter sp. IMCC 29146]MCE7530605.1 class I SAM-dependent methyltransferase [Polynucleobacter sp. IMCC 29146]
MPEINLLARYPKARRNIQARLVNKEENRALAMQFGKEYFDGTREQGYGGFKYDGRWVPIAEDIVKHYQLKAGDKVLDIGCAKGFLVKDLMKICPGLEVFGIDISSYAVMHCEPEVIGRLHVGDARHLPFPDNSFKVALSINTIHNFDRSECIGAIQEMQRVTTHGGYIQVDSYKSEEDRQLFLDWVLTAKTHGTPQFWEELFKEANYQGDYYWTVLDTEVKE